MDWELITHHLLSGYLPVIAVLVLYFIILHIYGKKQSAAHIIVSFVFCFYLIGILTMTGIWNLLSFSPRIAYVPFVDMIRGPVDTVLNILLFVPLGFFMPVLNWFNRIIWIVLAGFLVSLSVEIMQMFGCGASDINDLITNTLGACVGYVIYKLLYRVIPIPWRKHTKANGIPCYFELPLFWIGSIIIMITVQPLIFHSLF